VNIYIITQNDPFYLPIFFKKVIAQLKNEIVGVSVLSEGRSKAKTLQKFYNFYGPWLFCVTLFWYIINKMTDMLSSFFPIKELHSIERICIRHNVKVFKVKDINSAEFINILQTVKADVVISVASPQIFKSELINTPPLGCINVHGAPLPKYRGMLPSFWMLLNAEKEGAVTVHYVDEAVDSGDIILQRKYVIEPNITHHELIIKSKKVAADLCVEALKVIKNNQVKRKVNDSNQATYYSFPKKEDLLKFHQTGRRLR